MHTRYLLMDLLIEIVHTLNMCDSIVSIQIMIFNRDRYYRFIEISGLIKMCNVVMCILVYEGKLKILVCIVILVSPYQPHDMTKET